MNWYKVARLLHSLASCWTLCTVYLGIVLAKHWWRGLLAIWTAIVDDRFLLE